jgi:hypothetical protein
VHDFVLVGHRAPHLVPRHPQQHLVNGSRRSLQVNPPSAARHVARRWGRAWRPALTVRSVVQNPSRINAY